MTEVLLFHHAQGLTSGVLEFAGTLRAAGHVVHTPDLFEGQTFATLPEGLAHVRSLTFDGVLARAEAAAQELPAEVVYAGFSLGVMPVAKLSATRPGARGALFISGFVPPAEFGSWPGIPAQVHGMEQDPEFADSGDLDAAKEFAENTDDVELFVYPGSAHLFADPSLPDYEAAATAYLTDRVLSFLEGI